MEVIGIICEYSPFHNGHLYHINKIKERYPDSLLVLCLNGYFLERGQISLLSKESKTWIALFYGVDIVVELPALFGTQSADTFAEKSITLLHMLGVQKIIFGSETEDRNHLRLLASLQLENNFKLEKSGTSYPKRINEALKEEEALKPNDLLAVSYLKAILKNHYNMTWETILRTNDFHDTKDNTPIISASNIRARLKNKEDVSAFMPKESLIHLLQIDEKLFFQLLKARILTDNHLDSYLDVTEGLDNKLRKEILHSHSLSELLENLKSKRYTYNRLNRMLLHILLGVTKEDAKEPLSYLKILGFKEKGQVYLKELKPSLKINYQSRAYEIEKRAGLLYGMLTHTSVFSFDASNQPIILKDNEESQK